MGELRHEAERAGEERERLAAERETDEKARRSREAAIARARYLDAIAGSEPKLWERVDSLVATMQPKKYDLAVTLLRDLRDLGKPTDSGAFDKRLDRLRNEHARKPSFLDRLRKAGF